MELLFNALLEIVLSCIALLASRYIIPWLKEKRMLGAAKIAVEAAEQLITESGAGKQKFNQALEWIAPKFKLSEDEARRLIEAAVYNMKKKDS